MDSTRASAATDGATTNAATSGGTPGAAVGGTAAGTPAAGPATATGAATISATAAAHAGSDAVSSVDDRNPWLGLASFTEETQSYFYGREDEVAELARRVQRKLLTVLFGQSGLGKTSILRAGLVPRLRAQGYCPVYVRVGYGRDAPEPAEQIKEVDRAHRAPRR